MSDCRTAAQVAAGIAASFLPFAASWATCPPPEPVHCYTLDVSQTDPGYVQQLIEQGWKSRPGGKLYSPDC